jgi:NAD(P)-dependent dehydrogenase (short-subunit alcohol dehydrogenase family)
MVPSDRSMFLKIVVVILALGATGAGLLVARHQRAQAAHELAAARLRILEADKKLASLRARIASMVSPDDIAQMVDELGETVPLLGQQYGVPGVPGVPGGEQAQQSPTSVAMGGDRE